MYRIPMFLILAAAGLLVACGNDPELLAAYDSYSASPEAFNPTTGRTGLEAQKSAADQWAWVTIAWEGASREAAVNLDLHVVDPNGVEINLLHTTGRDTGRFLEHPECTSYDCRGDEENPRETIYWALDRLPAGQYRAWVENISDDQESFAIQISFGDQRVDESGSVRGGQKSREWTWTVGAEPTGTCLAQLGQLGVNFKSISISEGSCTVKDAVMISGPLNGVTYHVDASRSTTRFRTSCETAVALHKYGTTMKSQGVTDVYHDGSYSCRNISGSNNSSTHSYARAMDFRGFRVNGSEYSVLRDWKKGPGTTAGRVLRALAEGGRGIFRTVLTPDDNADHADHFHMDLGR